MMAFGLGPTWMSSSLNRTTRLDHVGAAFTLLESIIALALIAVLLSILLPALASARITSHREQCAEHLHDIGVAWQTYLGDHEDVFPHVPVQPGWFYGGMRLSRIDRTAYPDFNRPLTQYLDLFRTTDYASQCVCCPADRGIGDPASGTGTGERTAFESFGTSYRANAAVLDVRAMGLADDSRGMKRSEITTAPSRLVLCGDAVWYEVAESTGRKADWHDFADAGNMLFLDGSVRFMTVRPRGIAGPMVFDPLAPGTRAAASAPATTQPSP